VKISKKFKKLISGVVEEPVITSETLDLKEKKEWVIDDPKHFQLKPYMQAKQRLDEREAKEKEARERRERELNAHPLRNHKEYHEIHDLNEMIKEAEDNLKVSLVEFKRTREVYESAEKNLERIQGLADSGKATARALSEAQEQYEKAYTEYNDTRGKPGEALETIEALRSELATKRAAFTAKVKEYVAARIQRASAIDTDRTQLESECQDAFDAIHGMYPGLINKLTWRSFLTSRPDLDMTRLSWLKADE
jgi:chromosome segregation ATPase